MEEAGVPERLWGVFPVPSDLAPDRSLSERWVLRVTTAEHNLRQLAQYLRSPRPRGLGLTRGWGLLPCNPLCRRTTGKLLSDLAPGPLRRKDASLGTGAAPCDITSAPYR